MADVLLIHGAGDSAAVWERQVGALGSAHRLIALDLPGHGARLAEPAHTDHAANAAEVERALAAAGIDRAVVVGHSLGGGVALTYALGRPARLRALVLVASGARLRMHPSLLEAAREKAEAATGSATPTGPVVPPERCLAPGAPPELVAWLGAHSGQATAQAVYADFQANNAFDVMDRLGEIGVPTLVLGGAQDAMTPPKFVQFLADSIPGAQLALLEGAGHYPMVEQADAFNRRLGEFLESL
jgi:pimeloyl-ACP methyl ester carboxylesterase